jgi:CRP-like cAMP-binding protein
MCKFWVFFEPQRRRAAEFFAEKAVFSNHMKENKTKCDLQSCVLCRQSQPAWLPAIDAARKNYHFKKGEQLFTEGSAVTGMYFITHGLVKVHKQWGEEKELILRIAADGDILGHRGLGTDTIYPVSATALEESDICYVPLDFFMSTLKTNHELTLELLLFFAAELKESEHRMRNLAHMTVKGRVANALLTLQKKFGTQPDGSLSIQLSRQDFASYTGSTYETFFRVMNELAEEGLVRSEGKRIYLLKELGLKEYAGEK